MPLSKWSLRQRAIGAIYRTLSQVSCLFTVNILDLERWNSCRMPDSTHTKPGCSKRVPIQPEQGLSQEQKTLRLLSLSETMWVRNCPWVMKTPQKETVGQDGFIHKLYQRTPAPNTDGLVQEKRNSYVSNGVTPFYSERPRGAGFRSVNPAERWRENPARALARAGFSQHLECGIHRSESSPEGSFALIPRPVARWAKTTP